MLRIAGVGDHGAVLVQDGQIRFAVGDDIERAAHLDHVQPGADIRIITPEDRERLDGCRRPDRLPGVRMGWRIHPPGRSAAGQRQFPLHLSPQPRYGVRFAAFRHFTDFHGRSSGRGHLIGIRTSRIERAGSMSAASPQPGPIGGSSPRGTTIHIAHPSASPSGSRRTSHEISRPPGATIRTPRGGSAGPRRLLQILMAHHHPTQ